MIPSTEIKAQVKAKYNALAVTKQNCCGTEDCSFIGEAYETIPGYVGDADLGLGCGLPTQSAGIQPGNTVVDLGSGAGNDVFIARREAGASGRVIGIDMAEEMIRRAKQNLAKLGFQNVEFRLGEIEDIPLADSTADVVVSNCVMNLVPDKNKAYAETYRILKPGGHFCISDVVVKGDVPEMVKQAAELYAGCISGAMSYDTYLQVIRDNGFTDITIQKEHRITLSDAVLDQYLDAAQKAAFTQSGVGLFSVTLSALKPGGCCAGSCCQE